MKKNQWPDNGQATFKNKLQGIEREMEDRLKHLKWCKGINWLYRFTRKSRQLGQSGILTQ